MKKEITITTHLDFPIEDVFKALTNAEALSEWLMPCDFQPLVGHKFQFKTQGNPMFDGIVHCEVLELVKPTLLSFSWTGGPVKNSVVSFKLTAEGSQTRLDFEHKGFESFMSRILVRRILQSGWKKKILTIQLPNYLNK